MSGWRMSDGEGKDGGELEVERSDPSNRPGSAQPSFPNDQLINGTWC